MKKCFVYLFINACFFNVYNATILDLNEYLNQKGNYLQEMINKKNHLQHKRDSNFVMVKNIPEGIYPELTDYIKIFSLFNTTHILTKNGVYEIINNSIISRQDMGRLKKISENKFITFFKSVIFNSTSFIVFNSEVTGDSYIYQLINGSYNLIQNIKSPYARDAHFFINNNNLYLIMVNNKGDSMAESSICKWLGFHFDEIQTVFTTEAIKVGSFTTRTAEIIIILQDIPNKALSSAVFKFNNDEIKKIQLLKTYHGVHLDTYTSKNKKYLIIFNRIGNNVIYEWNDYQFTVRSKFQTKEMVHNSQIFILNGTPFLGISFSNKLQIYNLIYGKIKLENEIQNPSKLVKLLDFHVDKNGTTYIIESDEKNIIKIIVFSLKYNFTNTEQNLADRDILRECFKALEIKVDSANKKLVGLKKKLSENARFRREVILKVENLKQESDIENQIHILKNKFAEINSTVDNYKFPIENNIVINGKVNFKGGVNSKKITGSNIVIKEINGQKWVPEQWLRYTEPQTISGFSKVKTITASEVETSSTDPLFKDLLLKNMDQTINGSVSIESLTVSKLYVKKVNGIPMEEVYYKNKPQQIKGVKTFKYLNADEFNLTSINKDNPDEIISSVLSSPNLDLDSNITVENLEVETINGIPWNQLKENVFRINITKEITGPITFKKIITKQLTAKKIKDIDASNLLTKTTDQIIESNMEFENIFTNELKLETVNGIKIPQDVVFANENTTIQGHIKIDKLKVLNNVTLSGKFDDSFFLKDGGHIMGTKMSDLLQIYSGKITINGNLYLSNLKLLPNAKLIVSGIEVNPNFTKIYWTKNTHQIISVPVNFLQGIVTPHLLTKVLNNVKIDQYMLNNNERSLETDFKFENVTIKGNVILSDAAHHRPDFNKLLKEAVQTTGNYVIHGKKTYLKTLKAENLQTLHLDGVNVDEALNKKWPKKVTGIKTFKNMLVKNDADIAINEVEYINGNFVENFLSKVIFIDRPTNITHLDFENIIVNNLQVNELNDHSLEEYTSLKENLLSAKVINNLTIKGNATIDHIKNMAFLNDIAFSELPKNRHETGNKGISNEVEFTGTIKVKNFIADHINDISLRNLTRRVLNRQYPQTITASYTVSNLKAGNIFTKKINNVPIENIIDTHTTSPQKILSPNGSVSLSNIAIMRNLEAAQLKPCGLDTIHIELTDPPTQKWTDILIKGNVTVLDEESFLYRLFEKTVKLNTRNIIHCDVNISSRASMKNLHTNNLINNVHIPHLLEDAVLTKSDGEQKITGEKWFTTLRTRVSDILGDTNVDFLNEENVTALDNDIIDKNGDNVIRGKKIFYRGLQTKKFHSKTVCGVNPDDIVNLDQPKRIPEAVFDTLDVKGDLNIKMYNKQDFTGFIEKRLLINGFKNQVATGIYYFDNVEVQNFTTPYINNMKVEDIVFDEGTQNITSVKYFKHPVNVYGNISVNIINGVNITYEFLNSIPFEGSVEIDGNIVLLKSSNINGSLTTNTINGFPVTSIKELLSSNTTLIESEEIYYLKEQLIEKINENLPIVQSLPTDFMYLENSNSLQITLPNTVSGSTITSNGYVLLHINGHESGTHCGLSSNCSCPVQYTIEISPQNSINKFPHKGFQRIFSYDDDSMTVNFMTNSVSRSSTCRTTHSKVYNEISMMTWNTKSQDNTIGQFHQYDKFLSGYVSKVDFFTLNGKTYAVVGRYYDPVTDKYELDCSVLRFNDNKTRVLEIQIIPTKGVEEVYLLPTAQGVVLILGNKMPLDFHHKQEETQIFRFNPEKEQFSLLRTIPTFGCSSAAGVVHGSDSLIALAHKEAPVQVLKYYPEFDNYYFYQSFELDQPVIGISSFYVGDFGISDAYLGLVTSQEKYYIYAYQFLEGFKLKSTGKLDGLTNLVSFKLNMQTYVFASSAQYSSLLRIVKNGSS